MKLKKFIATLLVALMLASSLSISISAFSIASLFLGDGYKNILEQKIDADLRFNDGIGLRKNGYAIDYKYYSPVKENDTTKYPLVIWLQGQGNNEEPGDQLSGSDIEAWTTPELQQRFTGTNGAFIFVPRAPKSFGWDKSLIKPLKTAIDGFIVKNIDNIDVTRIYLGGYSLGGWMSLNVAGAYPEMFAAIFVACPALGLAKDIPGKIADIPVWLTSGKNDFAVNYNNVIKPTWNKIISETNVSGQCRFSTLRKTSDPLGRVPSFGHSSWDAVTNDMFSAYDGKYPRMSTVDGNGNTVKLTYPNGMISWLSEKRSDYKGPSDSEVYYYTILGSFFGTIYYIKGLFSGIFN